MTEQTPADVGAITLQLALELTEIPGASTVAGTARAEDRIVAAGSAARDEGGGLMADEAYPLVPISLSEAGPLDAGLLPAEDIYLLVSISPSKAGPLEAGPLTAGLLDRGWPLLEKGWPLLACTPFVGCTLLAGGVPPTAWALLGCRAAGVPCWSGAVLALLGP